MSSMSDVGRLLIKLTDISMKQYRVRFQIMIDFYTFQVNISVRERGRPTTVEVGNSC